MLLKPRFVIAYLFLALLGLGYGCKEETKTILPGCTGKAGEIVLVMDNKYWKGELGEYIKDNLAKELNALPQPEPIFDLVPIPHSTFKGLFIVHRNILIFNIGSDVSEGIVKEKNKWATSQVVVHVSASSVANCIKLLKKDVTELEHIFTVTERNRLRQKYQTIHNKDLANKLNTSFGISVNAPSDYVIAEKRDNFFWFRKETREISQGIFVYSYKKGEAGLDNKKTIIAMRDSVTKQNVPGELEGSYMSSMKDYPIATTPLGFNGTEVIETRGLWNVVGDFMGGPFISLTFLSKDQSKVICIDGYVYAPKYDKRNYLRQVEAILYSLQVEE